MSVGETMAGCCEEGAGMVTGRRSEEALPLRTLWHERTEKLPPSPLAAWLCLAEGPKSLSRLDTEPLRPFRPLIRLARPGRLGTEVVVDACWAGIGGTAGTSASTGNGRTLEDADDLRVKIECASEAAPLLAALPRRSLEKKEDDEGLGAGTGASGAEAGAAGDDTVEGAGSTADAVRGGMTGSAWRTGDGNSAGSAKPFSRRPRVRHRARTDRTGSKAKQRSRPAPPLGCLDRAPLLMPCPSKRMPGRRCPSGSASSVFSPSHPFLPAPVRRACSCWQPAGRRRRG